MYFVIIRFVLQIDDIMQRKVDNIFYVAEAAGLPHLERGGGRLVSRGRGRQLWANQRAEITHGVGDKRGGSGAQGHSSIWLDESQAGKSAPLPKFG